MPSRSSFLSSCIVLGLSLATALPAAAEPGQGHVKLGDPQYVLISFDNANGIAEGRRSRALAARTGARFTYFLSCVFLVPKARQADYQAPGHKAGRSNIGFAPSTSDVVQRLDEMWAARGEGHEIGSHACGHFDGKDWSRDDWLLELRSFRTILATAYEANHLSGEPDGWRDFAGSEIRGFRAPYLSTGPGLYAALAAEGYAYDASGVSRAPELPDRTQIVARFALPMIPEGPRERRVLAMDYNLFVRHTGGLERPDDGAAFEERAYRAFHRALAREMAGARRPLQLGFHFTMMNGGAYWRSLERFASEACVRPDVACVTYGDYLARTTSPPHRAAGGVDD